MAKSRSRSPPPPQAPPAPAGDPPVEEAAASGKPSSSASRSQSPPPPPPSSPSLPSGFRCVSAAKEGHGHPIYCVAWSSDLYGAEEDGGGGEVDGATTSNAAGDGANGEEASGPPPQCRGEEGGASDVAEEATASSSRRASAAAAATTKGRRSPPPPPLLRCLATCGGNHVTVYETKSSGGGALNVRQAYVDVDPDEVFYSCAFGGRGVGGPLGYGPIGTSAADGEKAVVLTADDGATTTEEASSDDDPASSSAPGDGGDDGETTRRRRGKRDRDSARRLDDDDDDALLRTFVDPSSSGRDGPQLLCAAGKRGIVKIIDTVRRSLVLTLSGHGDEINDMKFGPVDDWLLLTASNDCSLRLWNVRTATCVGIFAGHEAHRDTVLTVGWHPSGDRFASAGVDTTVKLWNLGEGTEVYDALEKSRRVRPKNRGGLGAAEDAPPPPKKRAAEGEDAGEESPDAFRTVYEQMPYFSSNQIHTDYVDCVQFVGDLVLSKSTADRIVLWKPDLSPPSHDEKSCAHQRLPNRVVALREFALTHCDVWFVRFQADLDCQMVAIGNTRGDVKVWEISGTAVNPTKKHFANLTNHQCASTVRMVSFSPDTRSLVATCDDSTLWKWDAIW